MKCKLRECKILGYSYETALRSCSTQVLQPLLAIRKSTALVPLNYKQPVVTDKARLTTNHRINIVKATLKHRKKYSTHNQADHEFLELYNTELFLPKAYDFLGSISIGTLRKYIQVYKKTENVESLIPQYQIIK